MASWNGLHQLRRFSTSAWQSSHIGAAPISLPPSVTISHSPTQLGANTPLSHLKQSTLLRVAGPLGEQEVVVREFIRFKLAQVPSELLAEKKKDVEEEDEEERVTPAGFLKQQAKRREGWQSFLNFNSTSSSKRSSKETTPVVTSAPGGPHSMLVSVSLPGDKEQRSVWGLTRSLISNSVVGVSQGYSVDIRLVGVGYRGIVEDIPLVFQDLPSITEPSDSSSPPKVTPTTSSLKPLKRLSLKLGHSHLVLIPIPRDLVVEIDGGGSSLDPPSASSAAEEASKGTASKSAAGGKGGGKAAPTLGGTAIRVSGIDKQRVGQFCAGVRRWRPPEPYNGKGVFIGNETIKRKEVKKK